MGFLNNIFAKLHTTSDSAKAAEKLNKGDKISFTPKSDRYTYLNQEDTNYDKKWKPENGDEKSTLSPVGYFRDKEGEEKQKDDLGINDKNSEFYHKKQISIPSTALESIEYDPDTEGLTVQFTSSSKKYFYPAVPLELVQALLKAPSKGEFFMKNIHDQYTLNKGHKPVSKKIQQFYTKYAAKYAENNKGKWKNK